MDFAVKSSVQALDPACGLWLSGKVVDRKGEEFQVRWAFYNTTDWIHQSKVREPIKKRPYVINTQDWKTREPSKYQKGEAVTIKKADGTIGDNVVIEENDPFECVIYAAGRRLKYEWVMEAREDEAEMELRLPFRELPRENNAKQPAQTQKTGKKRAQARRSERASPESPPRQDVDSENVPPPAPKRVRQNKTAKVQKKLATRIIMAEAPPSDDGGGDLQPYADGLANDATLAIETVVSNASAEGNPIQVPDEWKNATPPFACSALCDAKMAKMEQRLEQLENTVAMLRAALEDGQNRPPEEPTNFAAAPPTPQSQSLSSVIGDAMAVVADVTTTPTAPVPWAESRDLAATVPNNLSLVLMECGNNRTQLAKRLLESFFSTQERLACNTSGTRGKAQLDGNRLAEMRRLIFSYAPVSSPHAESVEWKRLKTVMDLANRHLRQSLKERLT